MKRKPLRPFGNSLRASSRKNRGRPARRLGPAGMALFFFFLPAIPSFSQGVDLDAECTAKAVRAHVRFRWNKEAELISLLRDGLESRITFTVRLFRKRPALLQFLGEILVAEKSLSQSAFFDFLDQKFVVEPEKGQRKLYVQPEEMLRGFFSWTDILLDEGGSYGDVFVTARIQFDPVRLMPPLTIVTLVGGTETYMSPWVRKEVARP
jgi:hypothetical protein